MYIPFPKRLGLYRPELAAVLIYNVQPGAAAE
jgi:hypothetical protein